MSLIIVNDKHFIEVVKNKKISKLIIAVLWLETSIGISSIIVYGNCCFFVRDIHSYINPNCK